VTGYADITDWVELWAKVRSSEVSKLPLAEHPPLDAADVFYLKD